MAFELMKVLQTEGTELLSDQLEEQLLKLRYEVLDVLHRLLVKPK